MKEQLRDLNIELAVLLRIERHLNWGGLVPVETVSDIIITVTKCISNIDCIVTELNRRLEAVENENKKSNNCS